ncbi:hypothetical protein GPALN_011752 [Globodera pallida]|nr:hypothetical protein GPALN_011752 [Globodera pallida]
MSVMGKGQSVPEVGKMTKCPTATFWASHFLTLWRFVQTPTGLACTNHHSLHPCGDTSFAPHQHRRNSVDDRKRSRDGCAAGDAAAGPKMSRVMNGARRMCIRVVSEKQKFGRDLLRWDNGKHGRTDLFVRQQQQVVTHY